MLRPNAVLGLICAFVGLLLVFVWVPLDTETGIIEISRGEYSVGDALAPTLAGVVILLSSFMLLVFERNAHRQRSITRQNFIYISSVLACIVVGGVVMRFAGPVAVEIFAADSDYRLLRDSAPWKYIGFVLGGAIIIAGLISIVERKLTWRGPVLGLIATCAIIGLYDLPFDDLLLPPNGDY
ncbi:MAG: hypothetical protein ACRBBQ_16295 [Cognatishimia sp.]